MKMNFHMGVTLRCYGNVEVEAESIEAALPLLTADFIGEHIEITETTTDSGQDLAIIDVTDAKTGEEFADYEGHSLPSPYDPPTLYPDHPSDTVDALVQAEAFIAGFEGDPGQSGIADMLAGLRAAILREQARPEMTAQKAAHTAGPWLLSGATILAESPLRFIATVGAPSDRSDEDAVNGLLLAAAPDLLAALKECRNAMWADDPSAGWKEIIEQADAAIAKAEGRANG